MENKETEQNLGSNSPNPVTQLTLEKAIELGEYDPEYLATFPEWQSLNRHIQFQYIKKALDNRHKHLIIKYSELNNVLDLRNKPHVQEAIKNVERRLHQFMEEKEKLFVAYSDA